MSCRWTRLLYQLPLVADPQLVRDHRFSVRIASVWTGQDGLDPYKRVATRALEDDDLTLARMLAMASEFVQPRVIDIFKVACGVRDCEAPRRSGAGMN